MGYVSEYDPDADVDRWFTDATGAAIANWIRPGDSVLELGCATGRMTAMFAAAGATVVAVDRESDYLERAKARGLDGVNWLLADLGSLAPGDERLRGPFDHVVLANVIHELPDPVGVLGLAGSLLQSWGLVHLSLQNPRSVHRLVGFATGTIESTGEISDRGLQYETLRLYDDLELRQLGRSAGLVDVHHEGVMVKPFPNSALAGLDDSVLEGFVAAGRLLAANAAMNYLIFKKRTDG